MLLFAFEVRRRGSGTDEDTPLTLSHERGEERTGSIIVLQPRRLRKSEASWYAKGVEVATLQELYKA